MVEFECPFCDEPVAVELASFQAPRCSVRCDACSADLAFEESAPALAVAA